MVEMLEPHNTIERFHLTNQPFGLLTEKISLTDSIQQFTRFNEQIGSFWLWQTWRVGRWARGYLNTAQHTKAQTHDLSQRFVKVFIYIKATAIDTVHRRITVIQTREIVLVTVTGHYFSIVLSSCSHPPPIHRAVFVLSAQCANRSSCDST